MRLAECVKLFDDAESDRDEDHADVDDHSTVGPAEQTAEALSTGRQRELTQR